MGYYYVNTAFLILEISYLFHFILYSAETVIGSSQPMDTPSIQ